MYIAGGLLCIAVIVMYVVVAPHRDPSYEPWGLSIKMTELVVLAGLGHLTVKERHAEGSRPRP